MAGVTKKSLECFYDVVSPYSWIGFELACRYRQKWGIDVKLRPFFLGGVMQGSDNRPPGMVPKKGMYMTHDLHRLSAYYHIPLAQPANVVEVLFEKGSLRAQRVLTAASLHHPHLVEPLSRSLWKRIWSRDEDITQDSSLAQAGQSAGLSAAQVTDLLAQSKSQEVKDALKSVTEEALSHGAFGSPTFVAHDTQGKAHLVFGSDRMHIIAMLLGENYEGPLNELAAKL